MSTDPGWQEPLREPQQFEEPPQMPVVPAPPENPPWTGWDVLRIAVFTLVTIFVFVVIATYLAQRLLYPKLSILQVARFPLVNVAAQLAAYLVVLMFMYSVATRTGLPFWKAVKWNWPAHPELYVLAGIVISLALQAFARYLPMPKTLPIDRYFQTSAEAWVLSIFGMTLAPLLEELFFRGFLYPVLARRAGVVFAVGVTSITFSLIHAPQLARAWGPVLVVFIIGLVLTVVRAVTKSVAPGFLMHMAYNGTISVLLFTATGGFHHLEKVAQ
jgi:uncharacterized protein